jgi:hypothetical protein
MGEKLKNYANLIYKSYMCVRLSVATKTRRGPETSEVLKTFEDLNQGVCLSVMTNSTGQGQGRAGQGKGRAGQPRIFFFLFFCIDQDYLFFLLATVRPD